MTIRQKKIAFTFAAVLLAVACVGVLAGGVMLPVRVEAEAHGNLPELPTANGTDANDAPADPNRMARVFADLQRLTGLDLRRPLVEKKTPPKEAPKDAPAPRLQLRLLGTAEEPGHSLAYFQKRDGTTVWLGKGDRLKTPVGEVVVTGITSETVRLTVNGQPMDLRAPVRSWQKETP